MIAVFFTASAFVDIKTSAQKPTIEKGVTNLKSNMRMLWVEHTMWIRNLILCLVDELPGKEQAIKRIRLRLEML